MAAINVTNTYATITNNVLTYGVSAQNSVISNNILVSGTYVNTSGVGNIFTNNIDYGTSIPTGNGNLRNVNVSVTTTATGSVFLGQLGSTSPDGQYQLSSTSIAKNAGTSGVDIGAFGGATPYIISGTANIPTITTFNVPINATGNTLNITVGAKSNP